MSFTEQLSNHLNNSEAVYLFTDEELAPVAKEAAVITEKIKVVKSHTNILYPFKITNNGIISNGYH